MSKIHDSVSPTRENTNRNRENCRLIEECLQYMNDSQPSNSAAVRSDQRSNQTFLQFSPIFPSDGNSQPGPTAGDRDINLPLNQDASSTARSPIARGERPRMPPLRYMIADPQLAEEEGRNQVRYQRRQELEHCLHPQSWGDVERFRTLAQNSPQEADSILRELRHRGSQENFQSYLLGSLLTARTSEAVQQLLDSYPGPMLEILDGLDQLSNGDPTLNPRSEQIRNAGQPLTQFVIRTADGEVRYLRSWLRNRARIFENMAYALRNGNLDELQRHAVEAQQQNQAPHLIETLAQFQTWSNSPYNNFGSRLSDAQLNQLLGLRQLDAR